MINCCDDNGRSQHLDCQNKTSFSGTGLDSNLGQLRIISFKCAPMSIDQKDVTLEIEMSSPKIALAAVANS